MPIDFAEEEDGSMLGRYVVLNSTTVNLNSLFEHCQIQQPTLELRNALDYSELISPHIYHHEALME